MIFLVISLLVPNKTEFEMNKKGEKDYPICQHCNLNRAVYNSIVLGWICLFCYWGEP